MISHDLFIGAQAIMKTIIEACPFAEGSSRSQWIKKEFEFDWELMLKAADSKNLKKENE